MSNKSLTAMRKNIYFLSDAHLGSLAIPHRRTQERRLVRFLDSIKDKAAAVYMLGDMFDFWDEYKYVVPKGFTRFWRMATAWVTLTTSSNSCARSSTTAVVSVCSTSSIPGGACSWVSTGPSIAV